MFWRLKYAVKYASSLVSFFMFCNNLYNYLYNNVLNLQELFHLLKKKACFFLTPNHYKLYMKASDTQLSKSLCVVFIKGYGIKQEKYITDNEI